MQQQTRSAGGLFVIAPIDAIIDREMTFEIGARFNDAAPFICLTMLIIFGEQNESYLSCY